MKYYVLSCDTDPYNTVAVFPTPEQDNWMSGERLDLEIDEPLLYELDPDNPGIMREFYDSRMPLMRDDLVKALLEAGVDNLQTFPALVRDPSNGEEYTNYKAVNIVGAIACLDHGAAGFIPGLESDMIDIGLDGAPIDEDKAGDALLFRLAENVSMILVHDKVKQHLEASGLVNLEFLDPAEWSG